MKVRLRPIQLVLLPAILALGAVRATGTDTSIELIQAARHGNVEQVRQLLASKTDVDVRQGDGASALHWASYKGSLEITDLLLRSGANPNLANDLGATPLWIASSNGNAAIVARLLEAGANPNLALASGETPLMSAGRSGSVETVRFLLAKGADVNAKEHFRGQTPLMWAADQDHSEVARVLLAGGADVHARSKVWKQLENTGGNAAKEGLIDWAHGGSTSLLIAARVSGTEMAQVLLDAGADVNETTAAGESALVLAAHSGNVKFAEYLLSRGANVNAAGAGYTALHAAVLRGEVGLVKALLDQGADPNAPVRQGTPSRRFSSDYSLPSKTIGVNALWLASQFGEIEMMRLLLQKGADSRVKTADGTTTLMAALSGGTGVEGRVDRRGRYSDKEPGEAPDEEQVALEATSLLVARGVDVNTATKAGDTALHLAARKVFPSVVEFLAQHGGDVNAVNKLKETPLKAASGIGARGAQQLPPPPDDPKKASARKRTVELLRQLGAKD
jgi:ankyrin repeat protein